MLDGKGDEFHHDHGLTPKKMHTSMYCLILLSIGDSVMSEVDRETLTRTHTNKHTHNNGSNFALKETELFFSTITLVMSIIKTCVNVGEWQ